jgi:hypothetical protein
MCDCAAHLTDYVIPDVPLRQWVLSVPFELRLLLAKHADALGAVGRIFVEEVSRWQREQARQRGWSGARSGAIQFPQRFGNSLNLNVHFHVAVPDGVFTRCTVHTTAQFHQLPRPTQSDLDDIALNVHARALRWLRRKGFVEDSDEPQLNNEPPELTALDSCLQGSLGIGELTSLPQTGNSATSGEPEQLPKPTKAARRSGRHCGFDVHAGVVVSGTDRDGRERLLRYCARPPLSLQRLSLTPEGMVAYRLRNPRRPAQTHRIMTPLQFMARIAALVPPPRCPSIRFHGVFAPHSSWRKIVVPRTKAHTSACRHHAGDRQARADKREGGSESSQPQASPAAGRESPSASDDKTGSQAPVHDDAREAAARAAIQCTKPESPFEQSAPAPSHPPWRLDWATLLKRIHGVDALKCPHCGGRLRFIAVITEEDTAKKILDSMGLPSDRPPVARARAPDYDLIDPLPPDWD